MAVPAASLIVAEGWRPKFDLGLSPRVREIAGLMAPGLWATAIYQVNSYVSSMLAFSINDSAGTLMFYANRLMELPIGVFAIAVSTVIYPLLSKHAVEKNFPTLADDLHKGIRLIMMVNVPAAAGLALLSEPIVRLLFERGNFTPADTAAMTPLLALYVLGLPFFSVVNLTVRAFYAMKNTRAPVRVATIDFAINLGLSLVLMRWLGAAGLVLASTVAIVAQTVLLQRRLGAILPGAKFTPLWRSVGKVLVATLGMSVVVAAGWFGLRAELEGRLRDLVALLALIPAGMAVYALLLWMLKIEGREEFATLLAKVKAKFVR